MTKQLSITKYVPVQHSPTGFVFIEILANVRVVLDGSVWFGSGYPYTVRVSRREGFEFNHGCWSIEQAQEFLQQHKPNIDLIAPPGKVRAYYSNSYGDYFYMGRTYHDKQHWRAEESCAAWLTPVEFDAVVAEAATGNFTRDKTIERLART